MTETHSYDVVIEWTGNLGSGTDSYRSFSRAHEVLATGKPPIAASSDPAFRGDPAAWLSAPQLLALARRLAA
ncbi:hypothetical protein [Streptomyces tubercidicus]|uniref:hypothetical protein n=1 Tax=Streptomyces tubercidicus TaxID=47759 RepID=UPI0034665636